MSKYYKIPSPVPHAKKSYFKINKHSGIGHLILVPDDPCTYIQANADFTLPGGDDKK